MCYVKKENLGDVNSLQTDCIVILASLKAITMNRVYFYESRKCYETIYSVCLFKDGCGGGLSGRASAPRARGKGFESHNRRIVSFRKAL